MYKFGEIHPYKKIFAELFIFCLWFCLVYGLVAPALCGMVLFAYSRPMRNGFVLFGYSRLMRDGFIFWGATSLSGDVAWKDKPPRRRQ